MFDAVSTPVLLVIFGAAMVAIWLAGKLSDTTDVLSHRLGMGEAVIAQMRLVAKGHVDHARSPDGPSRRTYSATHAQVQR